MKKGLLIIYSGPSGVGKSTILAEVLKNEDLNLAFSVSMTTRSPREGEQNGVDYFFVSKEEFEEAIKNDEFLEHAQYVENYYGTPRAYVEKMRENGKNVILEIDVQGGIQVIEKCPDAVSIFICPPSIEELRKRLTGRGTEKEEVVNKRVDQAQREIMTSKIYKYHVVNEVVEDSVNTVVNILKNEMGA
ncbi:MAG: guanylate kinase [Erysipelotrichaceae bacterium]|nr:guanylate kinase [Erysipelotrichaceae bacterium]